MNFYKLLRYGYVACKDDKKLYYHKGAIEREALLVSDDIYKFKYSIRNAEQFSKELLIHNVMKKPCTARLTGPCATRLSVMENGREAVKGLFGGSALWVDSAETGMDTIHNAIISLEIFEGKKNSQPDILVVEGFGVFVGGTDETELIQAMETVEEKAKTYFQCKDAKPLEPEAELPSFLPALRMMMSGGRPGIIKYRYDEQIKEVLSSREAFERAVQPVLYGFENLMRKPLLYIEGGKDGLLETVQEEIEQYKKEHGFAPDVIGLYHNGLFVSGETSFLATQRLQELYNNICICEKSSKIIPREHTKIKQDKRTDMQERICIVTGSAQGFGYGIAEYLLEKGANVVIADINIELAEQAAENLANRFGIYNVTAVQVDVSDEESVKHMVEETVDYFGGLDVLISNAGVLKAGSLEEMDAKSFAFVTKINYMGYFICAKYGCQPMKIQHKYDPDYAMDIIQINSKSGLSGSNKNFAYAGGKFGGIGLTQSFALELVPYNIKVNAICPGNLLDGPLWSDPEKGLFVQYLNAGKVPGAKTIADVREFYEAKVPMHRGCTTQDVAKAILYCVEQKYETGQAIPVTGGQNMLK